MSLALLIGKELGAFALKKILHREKEVELTEKQEKLILDPNASDDLSDLIIKALPEKLKDDVDDTAKNTVKTCEVAIDALEEVVEVLKKIKEQAENLEEKI